MFFSVHRLRNIGEFLRITFDCILKVEIARCKEHIQLKVLPSCHDNGSPGAQVGQSASMILASETVAQSVVSE